MNGQVIIFILVLQLRLIDFVFNTTVYDKIYRRKHNNYVDCDLSSDS